VRQRGEYFCPSLFTQNLSQMRKHLIPVFLFLGFAATLSAQTVIYTQTFNDVGAPDLPAGWSASSDQIFTNASTPSSGYSGASGGNNLLSRNCNPNGEERSFQVDGISSSGFGGLTVSFGHRRTNAFTPPVTLEWSSDGASWNIIAYSSSSASPSWALFTSATLPVGAENQSTLSFRWTYTTSFSGSEPCDNFAGNYRIDDFKVTASTVLPVSLVRFVCRTKDKSVHLQWNTASEISNDFFAVERSADGRDFSEIGRVEGMGDSAEPQVYDFTDSNPLPGMNYYRLRQTDFDGQFSYSPSVSAMFGQAGDIRLFPSPVIDKLKVELEKPVRENGVWQIFDLAGRLAMSGDFSTENADFEIFINELPTGFYFLRLVAGREMFVQQFQKQ
jgi:hypothetical protein